MKPVRNSHHGLVGSCGTAVFFFRTFRTELVHKWDQLVSLIPRLSQREERACNIQGISCQFAVPGFGSTNEVAEQNHMYTMMICLFSKKKKQIELVS